MITTTDNGWTTNEVGLDWIKHSTSIQRVIRKAPIGCWSLTATRATTQPFSNSTAKNNIVTLCMPSHSSHYLQPLDVGCFGPMKKAHGRQIEDLMRAHITHVNKVEFLRAFREAFFASMTEKNNTGRLYGSWTCAARPGKGSSLTRCTDTDSNTYPNPLRPQLTLGSPRRPRTPWKPTRSQN